MKKFTKFKSWSTEAKAALMVGICATTLSLGIITTKNKQFFGSSTISQTEETESSNIEENNNSKNEPVTVKIEELTRPYLVNAKVAHYYYDINDNQETRVLSIVKVPGKEDTYMKSLGVDYTFEGKNFDVIASTSGVVVNRIEDSIYGNMLCIEHESGIKTIYSSLGDFKVNKGDKVTQGEVIATSGESLYTEGLGSSLHFELVKNEKYLNPEKSYSLEVEKL